MAEDFSLARREAYAEPETGSAKEYLVRKDGRVYAGSHVLVGGVGEISRVRISFTFLVFADMFALDNIDYRLVGDVDDDGVINVVDLTAVITSWGACPEPPETCDADFDGDGTVGVGDLVAVIVNWSN